MISRIFWTLLFLGACVGWLVLSYNPQWLAGNEVVFGAGIAPFFRWLFIASAVVFVAIQVILVAGVRTFPTRISQETVGQSRNDEIRIHRTVEYFWTALPLLISVLFFGAVWQFLSK